MTEHYCLNCGAKGLNTGYRCIRCGWSPLDLPPKQLTRCADWYREHGPKARHTQAGDEK